MPTHDQGGVPVVHRVATALGPPAIVGAPLAQRCTQRYGSYPIGGDPLASARSRVQQGIAAAGSLQAGDDAARLRLVNDVDTAAQEMEARPEALDHLQVNRDELRQALIFVGEQSTTLRNAGRADTALHRLARLDPTPLGSAASPAVRDAFAAIVGAMDHASLTVDSVPPECTVTRDGRQAGTTPLDMENLVPGPHRISVECGGVPSLVHPVELAANTHAVLVIDSQRDSSITLEPTPTIRYATAAEADERLARDLIAIGRALGARRVYGVLAYRDVVRVVDVQSVTLIGESPVTDGARLRLLMNERTGTAVANVPAETQPPVAASSAPEPSHASMAPPAAHPRAREQRRWGAMGAAMAMVSIGLTALAGSWYSAYRADTAEAWALNTGAYAGDTSLTRVMRENESADWRAAEWGMLAGGCAFVLTGALVEIIGRGGTVVQPVVASTPGGAVVGVGGRM